VLTTAEATETIAEAMPRFAVETINLSEATGRVLRQPVCAERDQPPFDRVMMDGIALSFASFESGNRRFAIQSRQHAGEAQQVLADESACIEIMTGAVLPANTDCVIPVERYSVHKQQVEIEPGYAAKNRQFIHARGSDHRKNLEILGDGKRIEATDIAVIASCGLDKLQVSEQPKIRVISTGNELVAAGLPIEDHQIRLSNGPAVVAMLNEHGYANSVHDHLVDDRTLLEKRLGAHLQEASILILSGGVSMGKADFVPEVLRALGVEVRFHKIRQRPGKPMWFGIGPENQVVFALPGNPVSTLVCCRQYVIPALARASGKRESAGDLAALAEAYTFEAPLTCFLPIRLHTDATGRLLATPVPTNTSGDFAALSGTDGYLELASEQNLFPADSAWPVHRWGIY